MRMPDYCTTILFFLLFIGLNTANGQSTQPISPHVPHCGFDEMTDLIGSEDLAIRQEMRDFLDHAIPALSSQNRSTVEPLKTIPVVVHIIHSGELTGQGSNISDQQVIDQIGILNEDFCALNAKYHETA